LISTADGWRSWLVDDAAVAIAPHAAGTVVEDGMVRDVRIETVTHGRDIGFWWTDRDDPTSESFVRLAIMELPDGRSRLQISERPVATSASASIADTATADIAWDIRLLSLWLLALHCTVLA
jgi:hypothetical protein